MAKAKRGNGDGSIYQRSRDGIWIGAISLGLVGGKPVRRAVYGHTQKEVIDKLTKLREEQRQGLPVASDKQTVAMYLSEWLENVARLRLRFTTYQNYEELIRVHINPNIGTTKLSVLSVEQCEKLWRVKIEEGRSPRRVQYMRAVLRTALQSAVKKGRIARNVAALSESPRVERAEVEPLTVDETKRLIEAIRGHRYEVAFLIAIFLGLRRGEILGLTWPNVDLENRVVKIRKQLQACKKKDVEGKFNTRDFIWIDDGNALVPLKTRKSQRTLELTPLLVDRLKALKVKQARDQLATGAEWKNKEHELVFVHDDGLRVTGLALTQAWTKVLAAAELPKKRLHDARHGAGSALLELGVDLKTISSWLGHSTVQLTADVYLHSRRVSLGEAGAKLDKLYR